MANFLGETILGNQSHFALREIGHVASLVGTFPRCLPESSRPASLENVVPARQCHNYSQQGHGCTSLLVGSTETTTSLSFFPCAWFDANAFFVLA
jgi:hypothetical protein